MILNRNLDPPILFSITFRRIFHKVSPEFIVKIHFSEIKLSEYVVKVIKNVQILKENVSLHC